MWFWWWSYKRGSTVLSQNHRIRDKMLNACAPWGATCTTKQGRIVQMQNFIFGQFSNFVFFQMGPGPTHPLPNYFWIFGIFLTLQSPLASPEPPCCKLYATWVCMEALISMSCRAGCASRVSLLSVPRRGWLLCALVRQGLSLLTCSDREMKHGCRLETARYDRREPLIATSTFFTYGLLPQTGAQYSASGNTRACVEIRSVLEEAPQVVPARRRMSETLDGWFFKNDHFLKDNLNRIFFQNKKLYWQLLQAINPSEPKFAYRHAPLQRV